MHPSCGGALFTLYQVPRRSRVILGVMPSSRTLMKRTTIKKALGVTVLAVAVFTLVFWSKISEAFGPMKQDESYCLICYRHRVEKWVCGSKVRNDTATTEYSEWIDSFTPSDHDHLWTNSTTYYRGHWFGNTSIACGGVATVPRIFEQRSRLGEAESQQLASRYHELVRGQSPEIDFDELVRFVDIVVKNPNSLLRSDKSN